MSDNFAEYSDIELYYMLGKDKETSEKAFAQLYARHSPRIYAYLRRFLGNREDIQDIFQETFVRFYSASLEQKKMTNVAAFILKIARNLCLNIKKRKHEIISYEDYMSLSSINPNDDSSKDELLELIKIALELIPSELKEAFILREYDGLTYLQIADVTDVPISTVKIRLYRAKKMIRKILIPYLTET